MLVMLVPVLLMPVPVLVMLVPVLLMLVPKVVEDEPPVPLESVLVPPTGPNSLDPGSKAGEVGVISRLVVTSRLVGSLKLGTTVGSLVGGIDPSVTLAEDVLNGPPVPVDDTLGTPVPPLLTGLVPDAIVPDVNGTIG